MFTLQILHASDLEGGVDAVGRAPNFAAIVEALEADATGRGIASILLSAGDNYIPGPFYNAAGDAVTFNSLFEGFYNAFFGLIDTGALVASDDANGDGVFDNAEIAAAIADPARGLSVGDIYVVDLNGDGFPDFFEEIDNFEGRVDITIMNLLGFDASAVGNHEFDAGTTAFATTIGYDAAESNSLSGGRYGTANFLQEVDWPGIVFPYLSANLDFSADAALGALFTDAILPASAFAPDLAAARANPADPAATGPNSSADRIAPATVIELDGARIGVLGATTQRVSTISSTGAVKDISGSGATDDMAALAAVLQPQIDRLTADGIDKIVLVSHLQQFSLEQELATLLTGVDVIIAGGSDTISADAQDLLREGDVANQPYPFLATAADGRPVAIVSTEGEYSYVGRLVLTFDADGVIDPASIDPEVSGAFVTDEAGLLAATGADSAAEALAASPKAAQVALLVNAVTGVVNQNDGEVFGETAVYIEGRREFVRTQETTLGNLSSDANLFVARDIDPGVMVSIKNGGGIRASIGEIDGDTGALLATQANAASGKAAGEVSRLDIQNSLRFDNRLVVVDLSAEDLKIVLEHGVAAVAPGSTPGQFPQVGGIRFAFDPQGTAQVLDAQGNVTTPGTRVQSVALIDADGNTTRVIVENGAVVAGAPASIKVVTLNFLAGNDGDLRGGDGYPFRALSPTVVDLGIGEQDALAGYLEATFPAGGGMPFATAETPASLDARIQILSERSDTVAAPAPRSDLTATLLFRFQGESADPASPAGASEVVSFADGRLYVTNGNLQRIDIVDAATGAAAGSLALAGIEGFNGVQSVAAKNGLVAAAVDRAPTAEGAPVTGVVAIFDAATGALLSTVEVGTLPDAVAFSPDGTRIAVANEGEFNAESDLTADAPGSVSIIDVRDPANPSVVTTGFAGIDATGLRIFPGIDPVLDIEPEYVAFSPDGTRVFATLQENNGVAVIDVATGAIIDILPLGTVDHAVAGFGLDTTDNDVIDILPRTLQGIRMPDAIAVFAVGGTTYFATANEGDGRGDAVDGGDEARVRDILRGDVPGLSIDPSVDTAGLERLAVSTIDGDTDGDGDIDVLHAFSSRSFTIFSETGEVVFDSGDQIERLLANLVPERFLSDRGTLGQNRADAKGAEIEAIAVGQIGAQTYLFAGAERDSGVFVYNVSNPADARFVTYLDGFATGNISPETIVFIPAAASATGNAQIAVAYEISGTTAVYDLARPDSAATTETLYQFAFGRPVDLDGFDFWSGVLEQSSEDFVARAFAGSREFRTLTDGLDVADAVDLVFANAFGRPAEAAEQAAAEALVAEDGFGGLFLELLDGSFNPMG